MRLDPFVATDGDCCFDCCFGLKSALIRITIRFLSSTILRLSPSFTLYLLHRVHYSIRADRAQRGISRVFSRISVISFALDSDARSRRRDVVRRRAIKLSS